MQTFRSKKDWCVLAFVICMTGLLVQLLLTMYAKGTMPAFPVHTGVYFITIFVLWWPVFNTRYQVDAERLQIRACFKMGYSARQYSKISKTNNSVASPALSLKRLKIDYLQAGSQNLYWFHLKDQTKFSQSLWEWKYRLILGFLSKISIKTLRMSRVASSRFTQHKSRAYSILRCN